MSQMREKQSAFTPKKIRRDIKLDRVNPTDFLKYHTTASCEECSHFDSFKIECTFGFPTAPHLRDQQLKTFLTKGHMAFCRFHEID
jgi:hypothetical protein